MSKLSENSVFFRHYGKNHLLFSFLLINNYNICFCRYNDENGKILPNHPLTVECFKFSFVIQNFNIGQRFRHRFGQSIASNPMATLSQKHPIIGIRLGKQKKVTW